MRDNDGLERSVRLSMVYSNHHCEWWNNWNYKRRKEDVVEVCCSWLDGLDVSRWILFGIVSYEIYLANAQKYYIWLSRVTTKAQG